MISTLIALSLIATTAALSAPEVTAFQMTLNMALSHAKKRQASTCTPAELQAIQGAAAAVTACVQGINTSNFTALCGCYTTVR